MNRRQFLKLSAVAFLGSLIPVPKIAPPIEGGYLVPEEFRNAIYEQFKQGVMRSNAMVLDNLGVKVKLVTAYSGYAGAVGKHPEDLTRHERQSALMNALLSNRSTTDN